eukprot:g5872.t1
MRYSEARAGLLGLLVNVTLVYSFVPVLIGPGATKQRSGRRCGPSCTKVYTSSGSRSAGQAATEKNASGAASQESEVFDWLAANAGIRTKAVSLGVTRGGYRGLVTSEGVEKGQVILEVPSDVCLWSRRDGVISGLYGQTDLCWEVAGDLRDPVSDEDFSRGMTWDVRLALALLEATCDPQIGGKFWDIYGRLLPQPHTVTVPFCLPERLLVQLHNDGMAERARKQVDRVRSLYPDLMRSLLSHPKTAAYVARKAEDRQGEAAAEGAAEKETDAAPLALLWAFAMVRSRAFAADDDRFAFVPFLDMANHGFAAPTANFAYDGGVDPGVFRLQATRKMPAGEEVTISYGEKLNAEQLMVQYGFPVPEELPLERPLCDPDALVRENTSAEETPAAAAAAVEATAEVEDREPEAGVEAKVEVAQDLPAGAEREAQADAEESGGLGEERVGLMNELFMRAQERFAREAAGDERQFEIRVRKVLPLIPPIATKIRELRGHGEGAIAEGATAYLNELQAYRSRSYPSSEDQDRELLRYCLGDGRGKVDPRLANVVRYRIGRKESHSIAAGVLEEFLAPAPPPPPAPPAKAETKPEHEGGEEKDGATKEGGGD